MEAPVKSIMLKSVALAVASMTLMACELDGKLTANQDLVLKDKKGRALLLQAGRTYKSSIEKDGSILEIDIKLNGDEKKVRIRPAAGQSVPKQEGELFVSAAQAGQPVDFHGILNTDYSQGPERSGSQACSKQVQVEVCSEVLRTRPDGTTYYDEVCNWQTQTLSGQQDIEYHYLTTTTTGELRLLNPGTQVEAAKFYGQASKTEQVITWSGNCRVAGEGMGRDRRERREDRRERREERRERREDRRRL